MVPLDNYDASFADPRLAMIRLETAVVDWATELRARFRLYTPDALQLVSLLATNAEGPFMIGTDDFMAVPGLRVHIVRMSST